MVGAITALHLLGTGVGLPKPWAQDDRAAALYTLELAFYVRGCQFEIWLYWISLVIGLHKICCKRTISYCRGLMVTPHPSKVAHATPPWTCSLEHKTAFTRKTISELVQESFLGMKLEFQNLKNVWIKEMKLRNSWLVFDLLLPQHSNYILVDNVISYRKSSWLNE